MKLGFLIHLLGFVCYGSTYSEIHLVPSLIGVSVYVLYTYLYKLSFTNEYFFRLITPPNYSELYYGSHKLVSYGVSSIHALFISFCATLYLLNIIDNYAIKQAFFISMSYYFADIYYVISSTNKLTKLDYFTICHHGVMIMMYYTIFIQFDNDLNLENTLLKYMNRGLLAEYSVLTLNYSWYLVNTKQDKSKNMLISSVLTLVLYFFTRVVNFTCLIYNFLYDGLFIELFVMMPLFLINYYWFYKLMCKAIRIYNNQDLRNPESKLGFKKS